MIAGDTFDANGATLVIKVFPPCLACAQDLLVAEAAELNVGVEAGELMKVAAAELILFK